MKKINIDLGNKYLESKITFLTLDQEDYEELADRIVKYSENRKKEEKNETI